MSYVVDFVHVSTTGLESSPVAEALAGLRANEARYLKNKYVQDLTVEPAEDAAEIVDYVHRILEEERDLVFASLRRHGGSRGAGGPLQVRASEVEARGAIRGSFFVIKGEY